MGMLMICWKKLLALMKFKRADHSGELIKIPYTEIEHATKMFTPELCIGDDRYGKVFLGSLGDLQLTLRKLKLPKENFKLFIRNLMVLSKIHHRHLVYLIGYCDERSEMILVSEYVGKRTLRDHLYGSDTGRLSWEQRLQICIASALAIYHLHSGMGWSMIHGNVNSKSILLDQNCTAKVADFGLWISGSFDLDVAHCHYIDPEYFRTGRMTLKSDVYSFGVLLLEVLCSRPAIMKTTDQEEERHLAEWVVLCQKKGHLEKIMDPFLVGKVNPSSLRLFGETAENCLRFNKDERPVMREVLWNLEFALELQQTGSH